MQQDILSLDDVKLLVNTFYGKVREDKELSPIFNERIQDRWPEHLEKMYRFWQTVLLEEQTYFGAPFVPHADLPVEALHFERWLRLFNETVDELFSGKKADEAKWRGKRMAMVFQAKINMNRESGMKNIM